MITISGGRQQDLLTKASLGVYFIPRPLSQQTQKTNDPQLTQILNMQRFIKHDCLSFSEEFLLMRSQTLSAKPP
jgi:hypothetical protein